MRVERDHRRGRRPALRIGPVRVGQRRRRDATIGEHVVLLARAPAARVVVERGDSSWGAHVPDLPGCIAISETRDDVVRLVREAIALHIEELRRAGLLVPKPTSEWEFVDVEAA